MERIGNHPAGQGREGCIGTKAPDGCESQTIECRRTTQRRTKQLGHSVAGSLAEIHVRHLKCKQNQFESKAGTTARAIETLMGQYFD